MSVLDRIVLLVFFVGLLVTSVLMMAAGLGLWDPGPWLSWVGQATTLDHPAETAFIGLVLLLISAYVLTRALRRRHPIRAIVRQTELGAIRVSLQAVEHLVQRASRQVQGVRDVKVEIRPSGEGVDVLIMATVVPDVPIPAITDEVQRRVREYVTETVGVTVNKVAVTVRSVADGGKARVE